MVLLDTNAFLWLWLDAPRLGAFARQTIATATQQNELAISAISFWEIAMLHEKRRITLLWDLPSWRDELLQDGLIEIPVDGAIDIRANQLADLPGAPADRIIVATALQGHRLITADDRLLSWPGQLNTLDARR